MINRPAPHRVNRSFALCIAVVLKLILLFSYSSISHAKEAVAEVQDLSYGLILYHFYQQSYFEALTETLIADERSSLPFHKDSAALLRGGMSLSYGMTNKAEDVFKELLTTLDKEGQRDRAWFYLGKLQYLHDKKDAALQSFSKINEKTLEQNLKEEFIYYAASLLLHNDEPIDADERIEQLKKRSPWRSYYYFNRGATQIKAGDWKEAVKSFQRINRAALNNKEGWVLNDRAYIAAGFAHLSAKKYTNAADDFINVRLNSPLADKAMLGFGWAQAQNNNYRKALSSWQALGGGALTSTSVQESLLAVAYVYEKISAPASALTEYIKAADIFEQEFINVMAAITLYREAPISEIIEEQVTDESDWMSGDDYLPLNKQAPYLAHLVAQNHFQNAIVDRKDLLRMRNFLKKSQQRFAALNGVLSLQKQVWQQSLDNSLREQYRQRYQRLLQMKETLEKNVVLVQQEADGRRLVGPDEAALWQRVDRSERRIEQLEKAGSDVSEESELLRLYRGLLVWRANEEYSVKLWELKKQFVELNSLIKNTEEKLTVVETFSPDRFDDAYAQRMGTMEQRINGQVDNVNRALIESERTFRELAVAELLIHQKRLSYYLGQAKMSIARLYDAGNAEAEQ